MSIHKDIHTFQERMYDIVFVITYLLYFIIAFGLDKRAPDYLNKLDNFIKIYISLFLIIRFNPFRDTKFTELDRKIVFSAAVFVLATTTINKLLTRYFNKAVDEVHEKHQEHELKKQIKKNK
jgi:hypothetical protein